MASVLELVAAPHAQAASRPLWRRAAEPEVEIVQRLVDRARAELEDRGGPTLSREAAGRATALLTEALRIAPEHFMANVLLGETQAAEGRGPAAVRTLARACDLASSDEEESWCTLRLAIERSRAGDYPEAIADYERHIRLGAAHATAHANLAELHMAVGHLEAALEGYREAVRFGLLGRPGRESDETLALAYHGLGAALDRQGDEVRAKEATGRALALDPRLELLEAARPEAGVFFVPPSDLHYYRGLALDLLGRTQDALEAFERYAAAFDGRPPGAPGEPRATYLARAGAHIERLTVAAGAQRTARRTGWRVLAAAAVKAEGGLLTPLVDAGWRQHAQARAAALDPCFLSLPPVDRETMRLGIDVDFDVAGTVERVSPHVPPLWHEAGACLEARLPDLLRLTRGARERGQAPYARIELLLGRRRPGGAAPAFPTPSSGPRPTQSPGRP